MKRSHVIGLAIAATLVGATVGVALREKWFPPLSPFWRDFLSGAPVAGLFAVVAALIAYKAASAGAEASREASRREEWWDRASWALDLARSDEGANREIGLRALQALEDDANDAEYQMILAVTETVAGLADMDNSDPLSDNSDKDGDSDE